MGGLEALGISASDMTPAEAAELSRLLKQVKQLEAAAAEKEGGERGAGRSGGVLRAKGAPIPALITSASAHSAESIWLSAALRPSRFQ